MSSPRYGSSGWQAYVFIKENVILRPRIKRRRGFKGDAQPWRYGIKITKQGQMIQIDHMTVSKNGFSAKHFQAWDPTSKFIHAGLYSNAKSLTALKKS